MKIAMFKSQGNGKGKCAICNDYISKGAEQVIFYCNYCHGSQRMHLQCVKFFVNTKEMKEVN
jgi:hypothetical protein